MAGPQLHRWRPRLQQQVDELAAAHGVPGAVCGVLHGDDQVVVATGVANEATGVETTPDTLFQLGSISKLYTATLLMQAERAGLLNLDEPVRAVLHTFRLADDAATLEITPRHLLTHTSGIEGDHVVDTGRGDDALQRYVATLDRIGLVHPPDELYSYANSGYGVAGRILEAITGETFDRVLRRRLTRALGPTATTMPEQAILHRVAAGHDHQPGHPASRQRWWTLFRSNGPMGGLLAPVDELLAFARLHLDRGIGPGGTELLPAETVDAMQEPHVAMYGIGERRALGWQVWDWDGTTAVGHNGDTVGQRAALRVVPERRSAVAVLTNSPVGAALVADLLAWIAGEILDLPVPGVPEPLAQPADAAAGGSCIGTYERLHQRVDVARLDGALQMTVVPDEAMQALGRSPGTHLLEPIDDTTFATDDPSSGTLRVVAFVDPEDAGRAAYLHLDGRAHRRLDEEGSNAP
jgi:CubicO group peptidase (beta-lactamase class C family)